MSIKEFKLPDVGEGVAEGELVEWFVEPGDTVQEDQPVALVETDKAQVEVPSPYNGTVKELRAEAGEIVPVGDVIITFEIDDGEPAEAAAEPEAEAAEAADETTEAASETAEAADGEAGAAEEPAESTTAEGPEDADGPAEAGEGGSEEPAARGGRVFAPPSARRLARELGVDIAAVRGSGPGGRVSEADIRRAAGNGDVAAVGPDEGAEPAGAGTGERGAPEPGPSEPDATPKTEAEAKQPPEPAPAGRAGDGESAGTGAAGTEAGPGPEPAGREHTLAVPATRRVARELDVDLDDVPASETRDGDAFVTAADVRRYAEARRTAEAAGTGAGAEAEAGSAEVVAGEPGGPVAGAGGTAVEAGEAGAEAGGEAPATATTGAEGEEEAREDREERVPYRGIRRTIGQQMERSKFTAPHVTHHDQTDVSALVDLRADLKPAAEERGVRLTYMPFVMKAIVAGLREYPALNATLDEDAGEVVHKKYYNLGFAVATDAGLMVPVVDDVDRKGMLELADEVATLAERARERDITRSEMQGGTFTITNFGAVGGEYGTPIINYPEVAIMGLGAIEDRPLVVDGEVAARKTLPISLSFDHRVVDGAVAAGFANTVLDYLRDPRRLLLE